MAFRYRIDPDTQAPEIEPTAAEVVRVIAKWYVDERTSCTVIVDRLAAQSIMQSCRRQTCSPLNCSRELANTANRVYTLELCLWRAIWTGKSVSGMDCVYNVFSQLQPICNRRRKGDSGFGCPSTTILTNIGVYARSTLDMQDQQQA